MMGVRIVFGKVIDGLEMLDIVERIPVNAKYVPEKEIRIESVQMHANPLAL